MGTTASSSSKYETVATNKAVATTTSATLPASGVVVHRRYRPRVLLVYDTFEVAWDCCNLYRRWTDPDWDHHEIFLREKSGLRQLGKEVRRKLGDACEFVEMTLEEDLREGTSFPAFDVAVLLQHDWPTVNENPRWLLKFTNFLQMAETVPPFIEVCRVRVVCMPGRAMLSDE